jgi:ubiquitin-protein ligase E3 C
LRHKAELRCVAQEAFDPAAGLFLVTEANELYPRPNAAATLQGTMQLRLLGSMLGKALYEGLVVEVPLAGFFLKKVRGASCDINDLPSLDRQLHASLMSIASDCNVEGLDLRFTIARAADGVEMPLLPGAPPPQHLLRHAAGACWLV